MSRVGRRGVRSLSHMNEKARNLGKTSHGPGIVSTHETTQNEVLFSHTFLHIFGIFS